MLKKAFSGSSFAAIALIFLFLSLFSTDVAAFPYSYCAQFLPDQEAYETCLCEFGELNYCPDGDGGSGSTGWWRCDHRESPVAA